MSASKQWAPAARARSSKASLRYTGLWHAPKARGEERSRVLDEQVQKRHTQGGWPSQWQAERTRLPAEREMQTLWERVSGVVETSHTAFATWERYSREQGDLLRALEDLAAQERTLYELENRKDQVMTMCKLALANLAMWVRDRCFPAAYAHATWARLAPFFQLPGRIPSHRQVVSMPLRPFHDRTYTRDLWLLCQQVNEMHLRLPDGRLLLFQMQAMARPILHQQQRLNA